MKELSSSWVARHWAETVGLAVYQPIVVKHHRRPSVVIMKDGLAEEFLLWFAGNGSTAVAGMEGNPVVALPQGIDAGTARDWAADVAMDAATDSVREAGRGAMFDPAREADRGAMSDSAKEADRRAMTDSAREAAARAGHELAHERQRELVKLLEAKFGVRQPRAWTPAHQSILIGEVPEEPGALDAVAAEYADVEIPWWYEGTLRSS